MLNDIAKLSITYKSGSRPRTGMQLFMYMHTTGQYAVRNSWRKYSTHMHITMPTITRTSTKRPARPPMMPATICICLSSYAKAVKGQNC